MYFCPKLISPSMSQQKLLSTSNIMRKLGLTIAVLLAPFLASAQQTATVYGRVTDASDGSPVELVSVYIKGSGKAVSTDESGKFATQIPANQRITLSFKRVAYQDASADILPLQPGARYALDLALSPVGANLEVVISGHRLDDGGMVKEKKNSPQTLAFS